MVQVHGVTKNYNDENMHDTSTILLNAFKN